MFAASLVLPCQSLGGAPVASLAVVRPNQINDDLASCDIATLTRFYREGRYSVVDVVRWHLDRIRRLEPTFNAFVEVYPAEALAAARAMDALPPDRKPRGALWGVPIVIKGNTSIAGKVNSDGWIGYAERPTRLVARSNAVVVDRLVAAGAIILGQTNLPDMAASDTTRSSVAGRTGNARDARFSPGGSSGGTAVAVALSMAVAGEGTDTGNSIRNPASANGVVGLVPTRGLVSAAGVHPSNWLLDRVGPITRNVADTAIMLDVMAGKHDGAAYSAYPVQSALAGKRIGIPRFVIAGAPRHYANPAYRHLAPAPDTLALFQAAVERLRRRGATIVEAEGLFPETFLDLVENVHVERYALFGVNRFLAEYAPPQLKDSFAIARRTRRPYPYDLIGGPGSRYNYSNDILRAGHIDRPLAILVDAYRSMLAAYRLDAIVMPALQVPPNLEFRPLPKDYPSDGPYSMTGWTNVVGAPSIVVPARRYAEKLPFGIEFSGDLGSERQLIALAQDFERDED